MKNKKNTEEKNIKDLFKAVDFLAVITKKGFDNSVAKEDFKAFKEKIYDFKDEMTSFKKVGGITLFSIDGKLEMVDKRLKKIEDTLGPLVQISGAMQTEIRSLNLRVSKLEHKAGFIKSQ
jgi:hypothetical protein